MNKLTLLFFVALTGYTFGCKPGGNSVMPMQDSWNRTLGFMLYVDARATHSEIQANSPNYSYVFDAEDTADDFRATNPRSNLGTYVTAFLDDQIGRPDPLGPGGDTPASRLRTLQWWMYEADGVGHPDWILYQCDRVTPAYQIDWPPNTIPNMPLDLTNPAVIDWKLKKLETAPSTITALSVDYFAIPNVNHACGVYRDGEWVQLFSGDVQYDPAYDAAVFHWAREVRKRLAPQRYPKGLVVNCPPVSVFDDEVVASLLANVDGILDEYGFTDFDSRDSRWPVKIRRIIEVQNQGVAYYSVNYVDSFPPTQEQLSWMLASFLMAKEHSAYITITERVHDIFPHPSWPHLPEYDVDVGHPCGEMTTSQGVYVRDFNNGMALVNPSSSDSFTVALPPGNFTDLHGSPVAGDIFMGPLSGKVLVSSVNRCR
jgi:hypothetical protein